MSGVPQPLPRLEARQAQPSLWLAHGGGYHRAQEAAGLWAGRGDRGGVRRDPHTGCSVLPPGGCPKVILISNLMDPCPAL